MTDINKEVIDIILPSHYITAFVARNFPGHDGKISTSELWEAFKAERSDSTLRQNTGKQALFYAMQRDGWIRKRFTDTVYFVSPDRKIKRGRPARDEIIQTLKRRIEDLEAENERLKQLINGRI